LVFGAFQQIRATGSSARRNDRPRKRRARDDFQTPGEVYVAQLLNSRNETPTYISGGRENRFTHLARAVDHHGELVMTRARFF